MRNRTIVDDVAAIVPRIGPNRVPITAEDCREIACRAVHEVDSFVGPMRSDDRAFMLCQAVVRLKPGWSDCS